MNDITIQRGATAALLAIFVAGGSAWALNPQPEVPSKPSPVARSSPKALNPQPEVPSKAREVGQPKALNPQPEVPSKSKKPSHKKKPPGASGAG